jgi:hypothetical protein
MNTPRDQSEEKMSFSLWAMACGAVLYRNCGALAKPAPGQGRMHPQSTDGAVLRLRSRRALSPTPCPQPELGQGICQLRNCLEVTPSR